LLPLLLLVTAFIVYGSLYPWQFHAAVIPGNPLLILLQSWSFETNRYLLKDTAVNIVLYIPFGIACQLWLSRRAAPLLLALLLSSSMEMIQLYDAQRVCSMLDVVTNVTGAAVGIVLAWQFRSRVSIRPRTPAPLFLLFCWVCAYLFPFMPDLSTHHLGYKLSTFTSPPFSAVACFNAVVVWLIAARMMEAAYSRVAVPLLLLFLPVRLFVSGITLAWTDLLPALIACAIWLAWRPRHAALAGLSIAAIVLVGLAPFHFSSSRQAFSWIPFRALFSTDWEGGFAIFFRKCFAYGSAIWLLVGAGNSLVRSTAAMAVILAALEVVQLWLPNHVSESTDPLHAIILACVLYLLARPNASVRI
jgi:glycopeptide antibiotics resistance protein